MLCKLGLNMLFPSVYIISAGMSMFVPSHPFPENDGQG